jgi:hypothetical protein
VHTEPPTSGPELPALTDLLDRQRDIILRKTDGLGRAQLAQQLPPSSLTLAGLVNHLALVEDTWLGVRFAGRDEDELWAGHDWEADPEYEFRTAVDVEPEELRQRYLDACARSREVVAGAGSLDQLSVGVSRDGRPWDLRWIPHHLVEETARHAGHADLLRECIDGRAGQ